MTLELIDEAVHSGARWHKACEVIGLTLRTVQRWRQQGPDGGEDRRRGPTSTPPHNKLSEDERKHVLAVVNSEQYRDLPPKQIVPRLADEGRYVASEATIYRILEEEGQNTHRQPTKRATHHKPQERVATGPAQLLCWDITYLPAAVRGTFYYLYMFLDVWSRKIVGWGVHTEQCAHFAATLLDGVCDALGVYSPGIVLHSDNGKPMKGAAMLATMQFLGLVPSFSRPHVSDDNPFIESLYRTLKYRPSYPEGRFRDIDEAIEWVAKFVHWYNFVHRHSAIGFVTPHQRHVGDDITILAQRRGVYARAYAAHPERWTRHVREWARPEEVRLHPDRAAVRLTPRRAQTA